MGSDSRDVLARFETEKETYPEEPKDDIRFSSISTDRGDVVRTSEFLLGKNDDKRMAYNDMKPVAATLGERRALPVEVKLLVDGPAKAGGR